MESENLFIEEERDDRSISNPLLRHINIFPVNFLFISGFTQNV